MKRHLFALLLISCARAPIEAPTKCSAGRGLIVLAGGGSEGDIGDQTAWSFALYRSLIEGGDLNGDGVITVEILTATTPADPAFLPNYFQWLGETNGVRVVAENLIVPDRASAESQNIAKKISTADAIFIKGGDQGIYYDAWNNTALEAAIRHTVIDCKGSIGGTSAGAMSLSQYSFSGGRDLTSEDVLADAQTSYLNDESDPSTSGIHNDFFSFVPSTLIDTHYTARGRMGRLLGLMAKSADDFNNHSIVGIGIEERTGLLLDGQRAEVFGVGEVSFFQETPESTRLRPSGAPLQYTSLRLDRLTHGWVFDLKERRPSTEHLPIGAELVSPVLTSRTQQTPLLIRGDQEPDAQRLSFVASFSPREYQLAPSAQESFLEGSVGFTDSGDVESRMFKQETLFRALFDVPGAWGFFLFVGGALSRSADAPGEVSFASSGRGPAMASVAIDSRLMTHKGLSPFVSNWAAPQSTLRAAAMIGLVVHVLADGQRISL